MNTNEKQTLRNTMRSKRRSLSVKEQQAAAQQLFFKLSKHAFFKRAKRIGFYFSNDGEISVRHIFLSALKDKKACYFPVVRDNNQMSFNVFRSIANLRLNRYGIPEPKGTTTINPKDLDIVFAPLVAWSSDGKRLGMGGGYYDRCFAFKRQNQYKKPLLIGTAHFCQKATNITNDNWDIPMDMIATNRQLLVINKR